MSILTPPTISFSHLVEMLNYKANDLPGCQIIRPKIFTKELHSYVWAGSEYLRIILQ